MNNRTLVALPVFNEASHIPEVLEQFLEHAGNVLVVNDGSSDGTAEALALFGRPIRVETHVSNQGYGAALNTAFNYAVRYGFEVLVTIDCDGQHQPALIGEIADLVDDPGNPVDMVSGSRYLKDFHQNSVAPEDRRRINMPGHSLPERQAWIVVDGFLLRLQGISGSALADLDITDPGYAMPLQLWIQATDLNWRITEYPIPLVYLDEERSFGGSLDDASERLEHYRNVLNGELSRRGMQQRFAADCGSRSA